MAKIDDLMQGKKPGEIKIRGCDWPVTSKSYFIPFFKNKSGVWHGLTDLGDDYVVGNGNDQGYWYIYIEPFPFKLTYEIEENGRHYTGTIASTSILNCAKELVLLVQERCGHCGKLGRMCSHL